jgi:hypothetical protein
LEEIKSIKKSELTGKEKSSERSKGNQKRNEDPQWRSLSFRGSYHHSYFIVDPAFIIFPSKNPLPDFAVAAIQLSTKNYSSSNFSSEQFSASRYSSSGLLCFHYPTQLFTKRFYSFLKKLTSVYF